MISLALLFYSKPAISIRDRSEPREAMLGSRVTDSMELAILPIGRSLEAGK